MSRFLRDLTTPLDINRTQDGSLRSRGLVSLVGLAAQGVVRLLVAVVVGRLAGPFVLGVVAAGMATAQFLILLWPTTSGQAASRFLARARGRGDVRELAQVTAHLGRRVMLATGVLAIGCLGICLVRGLNVLDALCVAALLVGLAGQQFTRGVHYGVGAVARVVTLDIVFSLLGLLGVAAALLAGARSLVILLPLAAAYIALSLACAPRGGMTGAPADLRREVDRFVLFGSLGTIASAGLVQISVLVADRLGPEAAGHYAAASNLAIPLTLVSGAMSLVLYPTMAEAFGRGDVDDVRRQLDRGVRGLVFAMVPVAAVLTGLSGPLIGIVYGEGFRESGPVLSVLFVAVVVSMIGVPCVNALTSGGRRGIEGVAALSLTALVTAIVVWGVAVPRWGLVAVAVGYAAGVGLIAVVAFGVCLMRWRMPWRTTAPVLVAGLTLIGAGVAWLPPDPVVRALCAGAFVLIWVVVLPRERRMWVAALRRR